MSSDRFHKAAKDGLLDILREATKKECNGRDEAGMTPTLWAAFEGNIDALRLLVSRGGDPDKADYFGNTALHLAASRGHATCVTFLVNVGANIFALDVDEHTPKELAGMNDKEEILRYLDSATEKFEIQNRKKAKSLKEKAKRDAEKRLKEYNKREKMVNTEIQNELNPPQKEKSKFLTFTGRFKKNSSGSLQNLPSSTNMNLEKPRQSFSHITGRGLHSSVQIKASATRNRFGTISNGDFKIAEIEDGKRSIRTVNGIRRDSEVMYVGTFDPVGKRGKLTDVFEEAGIDGLTRSKSEPDFLTADSQIKTEVMRQEPSSILIRPGLGSIAFRKSNALSSWISNDDTNTSYSETNSTTPAEKPVAKKNYSFDDDLSDISSNESDNEAEGALERFLTAWDLEGYIPKFQEEKLDLDTLMAMTEEDIKELKLPLGHRIKLCNAIAERRSAILKH